MTLLKPERNPKMSRSKAPFVPPTMSRCLFHDNEIKQLRHTVYGNGTPGLCQDVHEMKKTISTCRKILWVMVSTAIVTVIESAIVIVMMTMSGYQKYDYRPASHEIQNSIEADAGATANIERNRENGT